MGAGNFPTSLGVLFLPTPPPSSGMPMVFGFFVQDTVHVFLGIKHMLGHHTAANVFAEFEQITGEWQIPIKSVRIFLYLQMYNSMLNINFDRSVKRKTVVPIWSPKRSIYLFLSGKSLKM